MRKKKKYFVITWFNEQSESEDFYQDYFEDYDKASDWAFENVSDRPYTIEEYESKEDYFNNL